VARNVIEGILGEFETLPNLTPEVKGGDFSWGRKAMNDGPCSKHGFIMAAGIPTHRDVCFVPNMLHKPLY
jgi:hypothetical protein